jgi:hypothetical protein
MTNSQWLVVGIGGAAIIIGIVCVVMAILSRRKLSAMEETPTVKAAQAVQMGDPAGTNKVELYGVAETQAPLVSPASGRQCIYYRYKVERQNYRTVTDSQGYTSTEEYWETVSDDAQSTPFTIRDETGAIWVVPRGADFVAEQTMSDSPGGYGAQQGSAGGGVLGTIMDTASSIFPGGGGGYLRTSEWLIPVGFPVYVLGNAFTTNAGSQIGKADGPFIVSFKSERELQSKYKLHFTLYAVFGAVLGCGGLAAMIYGYQYMNK